MAAAEARAAWQRMANRCFVQEDAKRAPKFCCPPPSSKLQSDSINGIATGVRDHPALNFLPSSWNFMDPNLPPKTKWSPQLQQNSQNDITYEELVASEELEVGREEKFNYYSGVSGGPTPVAGAHASTEKKSSTGEFPKMSTNFVKHETETGLGKMKTTDSYFKHLNKLKEDFSEPWCQNEHLMNWETAVHMPPKNPENESFNLGSEKTEAWWRIADKDELALFVAQKSLENFENCDLPRPQKVHFCGEPVSWLQGIDYYRFDTLPLDRRLYCDACHKADFSNKFCATENKDGGHQESGTRHSVFTSAETYSGTRISNTTNNPRNDPPESKHHPRCNSDKAELLEALHHSQTRAREAEMAAQQAYIEKEHIIKLFFNQASHLFAYKQWFRILQLEKFFLQLKIEEHQICSFIPVFPWMTPRGSQFGGNQHKAKKKRGREHETCQACRYAIAFAVGLGLVSAGLLFGWTLGWLLPIF